MSTSSARPHLHTCDEDFVEESSGGLENPTEYVTQLSSLRAISRQLAEFIAMYESAAHKIEQHEVTTGRRIAETEAVFSARMQEIDERLQDFNDILTQAGVARWRVAAEESLREGQHHIRHLESLSENVLDELNTRLRRLDDVCDTVVAEINEAGKVFSLEELCDITQQHAKRIRTEADHVVKRLHQATGMFQWQRVLTVVFAGILSISAFSLYVNDELPWEHHEQVKEERDAGRTLMKAWPKLSSAQQTVIQQAAGYA